MTNKREEAQATGAFAQALARIEEMLEESKQLDNYHRSGYLLREVRNLLDEHADSIVQLGKVAKALRYQQYYTEAAFNKACEEYDKLTKGEG